MKVLKKIGWFIVSLLPAILSMILQIGCAFVVLLFLLVWKNLGGQEVASSNEIIEIYTENVITAIMIYHVIGVLVFGLWYYLAYGRKKRPSGAERLNIKKLSAIFCLGVCMQIFTSGVLSLIYILSPNLLQNYMDLMEASGIAGFTMLSFIVTVFLAPFGEEFMCRGIILRIAGKVSSRFWIANCIQAFAFGLMHANLVQGIYAFLMGLVLGYIYGKYHNIWICVFLHGVINLMSNLTDFYYSLFPEQYNVPVLIGNIAISTLLMIFIFKILGKRLPLQEESN